MQDERDDRVAVLEDAAAVLDEWRPWVEGSLYDVCLDIRRLAKSGPLPMTELNTSRPGVVTFTESASACPSTGAKADWPSGHCEQSYGSVTTIAHPSTDGTSSHPPPPMFPRLDSIPHPTQNQMHPYYVHHPPNPPDPPNPFTSSHQSHPTFYSPHHPQPIQP